VKELTVTKTLNEKPIRFRIMDNVNNIKKDDWSVSPSINRPALRAGEGRHYHRRHHHHHCHDVHHRHHLGREVTIRGGSRPGRDW
jgi:hypothetical protein